MNTEENRDRPPVDEMSFEACISELETLVERFEQGKMQLADSITNFERGMALIKRCSSQLDAAEKKVGDLLKRIDPDSEVTLHAADETESV